MVKWAIELAPCGITYELKRAIKGQALANFIAEWSTPDEPQRKVILHRCYTLMLWLPMKKVE